jgi:N-carbamoylputrescine amidase
VLLVADVDGGATSPARVRAPERGVVRVGAVQQRWHADPVEHQAALREGIAMAADAGASLVCLQELTLSPYFAVDPRGPAAVGVEPEPLPGGPTQRFAREAAVAHGVYVHASLYEAPSSPAAGDGTAGVGAAGVGAAGVGTAGVGAAGVGAAGVGAAGVGAAGVGAAGVGAAGVGTAGVGAAGVGAAGVGAAGVGAARLGFNTAICVSPDGDLVARTRKLHLPVTAGYHEDCYFSPGDTGYPVIDLALAGTAVHVGFPTCWDQWFPELARAYALGGADVVVYPTAIGSEPDHPDFDTAPLWRQVIIGNGIANGLFMVAVNRVGTEVLGAAPPLSFYGSSFISDPYGRVLVEAPRDEPAVLVADLDLDARRDWLALFPFLATRRPDTYRPLVD